MHERIPAILDTLRRGGLFILMDHEQRENEGDVVFAASAASPEAVAFVARRACGLVCATMTETKAHNLGLSLMPRTHTGRFDTAFTTSLDAREGVTTGISAYDRSLTLRTLARPQASREDITTPGHIFPVIARPGGVLERPGHTEASVDLLRLAQMEPVGTICEIMNPDGTMASGDSLYAFAHEHHLPVCSVDDVIAYRRKTGE